MMLSMRVSELVITLSPEVLADKGSQGGMNLLSQTPVGRGKENKGQKYHMSWCIDGVTGEDENLRIFSSQNESLYNSVYID